MLTHNTRSGIKYTEEKKLPLITWSLRTKNPSNPTKATVITKFILPTNPTPQIRSPQHSTHLWQIN